MGGNEPESVLLNMVTTTCMWLFKCKLSKFKINCLNHTSYISSVQSQLKHSSYLIGSTEIEHFHHSRKFYCSDHVQKTICLISPSENYLVVLLFAASVYSMGELRGYHDIFYINVSDQPVIIFFTISKLISMSILQRISQN